MYTRENDGIFEPQRIMPHVISQNAKRESNFTSCRYCTPRRRRKTNHPRSKDLGRLTAKMRALQHACLAPSLHHVYRVGCRHYNHFYHRHNLHSYPLTQKVLMLYVTDLADSLSFKSIKLYLSVIKHMNIALGFKNLIHKMAQLHMLPRGIKQTLGNKGVKKKHQPITLPLL